MRFRISFGAAMVVALLGITGVAGAAPSGTSPYTCAGGDIPSGNYASITVTGFCDVVPDAVISVVGNLNVADGAFFDAQSAGTEKTAVNAVTIRLHRAHRRCRLHGHGPRLNRWHGLRRSTLWNAARRRHWSFDG